MSIKDSICGCTITRRHLERDLRLIRLDLAGCGKKYPEWRKVLRAREAELVKQLQEDVA